MNFKTILISLLLSIITITCSQARKEADTMNMAFETEYLRLSIGPDAKLAKFTDKESGKDYSITERSIAAIKKSGQEYRATSAVQANDNIKLGFGDSGVNAVIKVNKHKQYLVFEVISVSDADVDEFTFLDAPLRLKEKANEPFAACALALNLKTNISALPGATNLLKAACYKKFGFEGAQAAVIGCPTDKLRKIMQEAVSNAPDLPHSPIGGPWALDAPINKESYVFNFGDLSENNVDQWIDMAKNLGITQIDFHGGSSFRFGDCKPNAATYPEGRKSFKAVIDKLHAAGLKAGLHTYAFFMDKSCPWVTPVPDPRLGKDATFTLADDISAEADNVPVVEDTKDMSTTTGFFVRNSVTLQIDDELIVYTGISKEAPYAFTGCKRGALGTKVAEHKAGAKVHHLKECFGLFTPDADSTLFEEVAAATSDFYNECGFDMIYLDALDGEDILGGWENAWHYGSKFVFEMFKRLNKPALMEMSTFHHHLWYVRSRMGAWDHPVRSYKKFVDIHCEANEGCKNMFLPSHLGWWKVLMDANPQIEPTFSDDIEYLCCKCIANDCGISPQGFTPETMQAQYNLRRLGGIIKKYEDLRNSNIFSEKIKTALGKPGADFTLVEDAKGKPAFKPVVYDKHKVEALNSATSKWSVDNKFNKQPARMRIEALMSAAPFDSPQGITMIDFKDISQLSDKDAAPGVTMNIAQSTEQVNAGDISGCITALKTSNTNASEGKESNFSVFEHGQRQTSALNPAWAKTGVVWSPTKNLGENKAMGVWVYGDGQGEVLNFQLKSPIHLSTGIADYYVPIDFKGWRYFELLEPEGERTDDYYWPYGGNVYALYRELIRFDQVETLSIWCNNLPANKEIKCYVSPVKALPVVSTKLVNPSVTINGKTITFPAELQSGMYIEYNSTTDCKLYDSAGNLVSEIKPQGDAPELKPGSNEASFNCQPLADGINARARVTVISQGDILKD